MRADNRTRRCFWRRADVWVAVIVLLTAVALLAGTSLFSRPGTQAQVTTLDGVLMLPLDHDVTRELTGRNGLVVTLRVQDGRVRFEASECPDKLCVHSGWLSRAGQSAACLPAGIAVRIVGGEQTLDAVVG